MTEEIWKSVKGTPYEVSSLGNVRRGGRILKKKPHTNGYLRVCFSINAVHSDKYIHRLVCEAFHGEPDAGMHADHIDGDRSNNEAKNLRWLDPESNRLLRKIRRGSEHANSKLSDEVVRAIRAMPFAKGQDKRLSVSLGVSRETVRDVRLGKVWRHIPC